MKKIFGMFFIAIICIGCENNMKKKTTTFWVNSAKVDCAGVSQMQCLQIKRSKEGNWENFYQKIEGFTFEPGFIYTIEVTVDSLPTKDIHADASALKYNLVKIHTKEQDRRLRLHDIWVLSHVNKKQIDDTVKRPTIEISISKMSLQGTDSCNRIKAIIEKVSETDITFGNILGTRKMCPDMSLANIFNDNLNKVKKYKIEQSRLFLYDSSGKEILQFRKID